VSQKYAVARLKSKYLALPKFWTGYATASIHIFTAVTACLLQRLIISRIRRSSLLLQTTGRTDRSLSFKTPSFGTSQLQCAQRFC